MNTKPIRLIGLVTTLSVVCCLLTLGASPVNAEVVYETSFGGTGTGSGEFSRPDGIAVNYTTGHVYVTDQNLHRVQEFDSAGNFLRMWGKGVNQTTGGNLCPVNPTDTCQAGLPSTSSGGFKSPQGIGVDNSSGPASGSVYVQDGENNRVQRFTEDGEFVLMWGKEVDQTTGADVCTASSGHTCKAGGITGDSTTQPEVPSAPGEFSGWTKNHHSINTSLRGPDLAVDGVGYVYVSDGNAVPAARIEQFDSSGAFVGQVATLPVSDFVNYGVANATNLATTEDGTVFVVDGTSIKTFDGADFTPNGLDARYNQVFGPAGEINRPSVDPYNDFLFTLGPSQRCDSDVKNSTGVFEFSQFAEEVDCTVPSGPAISVERGGTAVSPSHLLYVIDVNAAKVLRFATPTASAPDAGSESASEVTSDKAVVHGGVTANLDQTTYRVEYGTSPCSVSACAATAEFAGIGASTRPKDLRVVLTGLEPETTYYYRFVATNGVGSDQGADQSFRTYAEPEVDNTCPNNLARQQTHASLLLDCRGYELVSAEDQGGYNVESDLVAGGTPFAGYPQADSRALYAVHNGGIPGSGKPTNRGPDPYVATRDEASRRWSTEYVGVAADVPSVVPFSSRPSGSDDGLNVFAFAGPDSCDPCFANGETGIPVHVGDGSLVQGMAGSMSVGDPQSAGEVRKPVSGDGSHFIFGTTQQFEPDGNDTGTDVTIYDRDLESGQTQVVSRMTNGSTIADSANVAELDVSTDGSRILIGDRLATDDAGAKYWHLYMHLDHEDDAYDLTPGAGNGALYAGMTRDGSRVYFATRDSLVAEDTDTSVDLYEAEVGAGQPVALHLLSAGSGGTGDTDSCDPAGNSFNASDWNVLPGGPTDCSVAAIGGGGGVASAGGGIYFLSPEKLDGGSNGIDGAPNLYLSRPGEGPHFVVTLESGASSPLPPLAHSFLHSFGTFTTPEGVAIDHSTGDTYVMDNDSTLVSPGGFVQKFDADGNPDGTFGSGSKIDGTGTPTGPFVSLADGSFVGLPEGIPSQLAVDNDPSSPSYRDLYVPDLNGVVDKFSSSGVYESQISLGGDFPLSVAVSAATGKVYVGGFSGSVYAFTASGAPVTSFGVAGAPIGIGVDSSDNVYVALGGSTEKYSSSGTHLGTLDPGTSHGVAVDPVADHVYVDRGSSIKEYDAGGSQVGTEFGSGILAESANLAVDDGRVVASNKASGSASEFGPRVTPKNRAYDQPLVIDSVDEAEVRHPGDFQTTPDGDFALFRTIQPLTGFDSVGHYEIFRYDAASEAHACVSCTPTGLAPAHDAVLASNGSSMSDDGRVFFSTDEPLVLRDTNSRSDAYEWKSGRIELISTGSSSFDSGLLSVTSDGRDVFFFTREVLAANDHNGPLMKLYDARVDGGFFRIAPPPPCAASDECHGPGSQAAPVPAIGTLEGDRGNAVRPTDASSHCNARKLEHRAEALSRRAQALRRRAGRVPAGRAAALKGKAEQDEAAAKSSREAARRCRKSRGTR